MQQTKLNKAPAHYKARIMRLLADCKAMLKLHLVGEAQDVLAQARDLMAIANSDIPQAIKYCKRVYIATRNSDRSITVFTYGGGCITVGTGAAYLKAVKQGAI